jgi:L-threonylcarbamoyladenylate synthase
VKASDRVGKDFRDSRGTVALRCPDHQVVQDLIRASGGPIITTSANTSGKHAPGSFDELESRIVAAADLTLDGGETKHGMASTVVDCTGPEPVIIRDGAIPADRVAAVAAAG